MPPSTPDLFEMRRLESLSNTIYDLPKTGSFASLPDWVDLYRLHIGKLSALMLPSSSPACSGSAITAAWRGSRRLAAA